MSLVNTPHQVLFVLFATRGSDAVAGSLRELFYVLHWAGLDGLEISIQLNTLALNWLSNESSATSTIREYRQTK